MLPLVLIIHLFFPILSTPFLIAGLYFNKKYNHIYILLLILNLSILGLYFQPVITNDLYRHFEFIDYMKFNNIKTIFSTDTLFIKNLWFYIIHLSGFDNLLPFSAILMTYIITLNDIIKFSKISKFKNTLTINMVILVLLYIQLIWVMSGIRFSVAYVLFLHGLYKEYVNKQKNVFTYLFYIVPIFIHYSIFVLILIRILLIFKNKKNFFVVTLLLVWGMFTDAFSKILYLTGIPYFQGISMKIDFYLKYTNVDSYYIFTNILKLVIAITLVSLIVFLKKNLVKQYHKYEDLYLFILYLSLFCLGGVNVFIIPDRFGFVLISLFPTVFLPFYNYNKSIGLKYFMATIFFPIFFLGLYLQYVPLKSTNYSINIAELLSSNIFQLLLYKI